MNNNNPSLTPNAKALRKNMTAAERKLWYEFLKDLPVQVKRQRVIDNYIVDFYIPSCSTVIEVDGGQHYEEQGLVNDRERDKNLKKYGYKILRYPNNYVLQNFNGVCEDILRNIDMWEE